MRKKILMLWMMAAVGVGLCAKVGFSQKIYLPVEERVRPLSLPPRTFKLDLGADVPVDHFNHGKSFFEPGLSRLQISFLHVGKRAEFTVLPLMCRYYLKKDVVIQDTSLCLKGLNVALIGGLSSLVYSSAWGWETQWSLGYEMKTLLGEKNWFFSNAMGSLTSNMIWSMLFRVGTGHQVSRRLSVLTAIEASVLEYEEGLVDISILKSHAQYIVKLPVDCKWNLSRNNGFLLRSGLIHVGNTVNDDFLMSFLIGFQYSWHW